MIAFIDNNGWQSGGLVKDVSGMVNIGPRFAAFGWHTQEIDGHDFDQILEAVEKAQANTERPSVIVAKTIKGKGIPFTENDNSWHKRVPTKEELEAAVALVQQYVPPSPDLMQVVMNAGTASLAQAGPGAVALKFPGYVKKGDALTLTFDSTVKALRQIDVNTWLDEPESAVNLRVTMQALPDGTSYPGSIVFELPKRQLQVKITKSNYQKIAQ